MAEQDGKHGSAAQGATIRYIDQPGTTETFADSVNQVHIDGQLLRLEFGVTRLDEIKPNAPVTGRRYPARRIVLTPAAIIELINRLQQVRAALTQVGAVKPDSPPDEPAAKAPAPDTKPAKRGFWETLKKG